MGSEVMFEMIYLSNPRQYVTYVGVVSTMKGINCGVPKGSIIRPLLFLVYINDLYSMCRYTTHFSFADDSNLFCNDVKTMESIIDNELTPRPLWLKVNKLSLNIYKNSLYGVFKEHNSKTKWIKTRD